MSDTRATTKERCVCAALKLADGEIIQGRRHYNCLAVVGEQYGRERHFNSVQGFMTSEGRFVDRCEGMQLQRESGVPCARWNGRYSGNELFSEDLY